MIQCLTKNCTKRTRMGHKAFTLTELILSISFSVLLMTGVYSFYNASSKVYTSGVAGQNLQNGANIVLSHIIEGDTEAGVVYRLSTGVSYMIPNGAGGALYTCGGAAQATPCNANNVSGELYYCQDSPCTSNDATARWYYLNSTGTALMYHYPNCIKDQTVYQAPTGATLSLRFSPAQVGTPAAASANVVEIDVDLSQSISPAKANSRTNSGDASTFVLLRNHP